jgi:hypothetical protein
MTIRTVFDGQRIVLPKELEGHDPCIIEIVLADESKAQAPRRNSLWEVVAESRGKLPSETILREISEDRDSWGDK